MSRKRKAPKKIPIVDPKYKSVIIPKLINSIMLDQLLRLDLEEWEVQHTKFQ